MKELDLPVVAMSTNLNKAFISLKKSSRAALVSEHQGAYHLFSAEKIAVARHRGLTTLSDLTSYKGLKPIIIASARGSGRVQFGAADRKKTVRGGSEFQTRSAAAAFSLKGVSAKSVVLAVRNISVATRFAAPPHDYYCDGPRHHSFPPPDVSVGDICPRCGYTVVAAI